MKTLRLAPILALLLASGCGLLYTDVRYPLAYRAATPSDVKAGKTDKRVEGRACNRALFFLAAWGDGGYAGAVRDALKGEPDAILYDVKTDIQGQSYVLGLYSSVCTLVSGKLAYP